MTSTNSGKTSVITRLIERIGAWRERVANVFRDYRHVHESEGKACATSSPCECVKDQLDTVSRVLTSTAYEYIDMLTDGTYPKATLVSAIVSAGGGKDERVELADEEIIGLVVGITEGMRFARNVLEATFGTTLTRQECDSLSHDALQDGCRRVLNGTIAMYVHEILVREGDGDGKA